MRNLKEHVPWLNCTIYHNSNLVLMGVNETTRSTDTNLITYRNQGLRGGGRVGERLRRRDVERG